MRYDDQGRNRNGPGDTSPQAFRAIEAVDAVPTGALTLLSQKIKSRQKAIRRRSTTR